jgi:hypothetical protein
MDLNPASASGCSIQGVVATSGSKVDINPFHLLKRPLFPKKMPFNKATVRVKVPTSVTQVGTASVAKANVTQVLISKSKPCYLAVSLFRNKELGDLGM